jgi:ATP-dependent DNA ligase
LEKLLSGFHRDRIVVSEAVLGQGRHLFRAVRKLGLEGIMAKSLDGAYRPGQRTAVWKKIKVTGYNRPARPHCSFVCR